LFVNLVGLSLFVHFFKDYLGAVSRISCAARPLLSRAARQPIGRNPVVIAQMNAVTVMIETAVPTRTKLDAR